jgi:type IV fimbrial biogenesis protein FimT
MIDREFQSMRNRSGFSVTELMVTVAIAGVLTLVAMPQIKDWLTDYRLRAAARELFSNIQSAKLNAIKQNRDWAIVFDVGNNKYYICSEDGADNDWDLWADNDIELEVDLDDHGGGVTYGHGAATEKATSGGGAIDPNEKVSYTDDVATFNPRGTGKAGYVYLENMNQDTTYAVGTPGSGVVKIKKWNPRSGKWE